LIASSLKNSRSSIWLDPMLAVRDRLGWRCATGGGLVEPEKVFARDARCQTSTLLALP
jgi:hypothetical protein